MYKIIFSVFALQVTQRDVPGIDVAYLAMDTEDGVEVVWNEVQFSARRVFKEQEVNKVFILFLNVQLPHEVKDNGHYW